MTSRQARFVTVCQQLLALGVVLAFLTPAAGVLSLDVVGRAPGAVPLERQVVPGGRQAPDPAGVPAAQRGEGAGDEREAATATVPSEAVDAEVTEVPLTTEGGDVSPEARPEPAPSERSSQRPGARAGERPGERPGESSSRTGPTRILSAPQSVDGFGTVGVTWSSDERIDDAAIDLQARSLSDGRWGPWQSLEYHDEHAPDPGSTEAQTARPGSEPRVMGEVDSVQVLATATQGTLPADLTLAVVEPGEAAHSEEEAPAIDLGADDPEASGASGTLEAETSQGTELLELQADVTAPKPQIFSRQQWGANESLRDGSPRYGSISAGFVHHTVNGNSYSRDDVPGILRSIYAYHTRSRGWSDIGYNFLVDKFGRIWEGRYGGVARPVVGAHTLGYNDYSFAMSAIGNYEEVRPSDATVEAYAELFAWKLGLAGVSADDMRQSVGSGTFAAINGHRDAGQTACPGQYLYNRIGDIRRRAAAIQAGTQDPDEPDPEPQVPTVAPRHPDSDLVGTAYPDVVVRRASDKRGMIVPTGGLSRLLRPSELATRGWSERTFEITPDVTGDGRADLLVVNAEGRLDIRPGTGEGRFGSTTRTLRRFAGHGLLAAPGDVNGDDRNDLVARSAGRLVTFLQRDNGGFRRVERQTSLRGQVRLLDAGDVNRDGRVDLWTVDGADQLRLLRGAGGGEFTAGAPLPGDWSDITAWAGGSDHTTDAIPDLVVQHADGEVMVLPGRGDGTLARAVGPLRTMEPLASMSTAGQLTGSAAADVVAATAAGRLVVIPAKGTFDLGAPVDTGQRFGRTAQVLNAGDFNGDGHGDVITRRGTGALMLYRGRGTGRLTDPVRIGTRAFSKVSDLRVTLDVTGDDRPDLLGSTGKGTTMVWPGAGAGMVGTASQVVVDDDEGVGAVPQDGYDWTIRISDLTRRGRDDIVVHDPDTGSLQRFDGRKEGLTGPRHLGELRGYDLGG